MKPAQLISRILIAVLTPLLAVLGFTGCGDDDDDDVAEYGAPYVELNVDGTVTDTEGNPIQGIVLYADECTGYSDATSGADGKWSYSINWCDISEAITENHEVLVRAVDEDGDANGGEFADTSVTVSLTQTAEGDGGWFQGAYEASDVVVEMELESAPDAGTDAGSE